MKDPALSGVFRKAREKKRKRSGAVMQDALQGLKQNGHLDGLGDVGVHTGVLCFLQILGKDVGGHGDDRDGALFTGQGANGARGESVFLMSDG